MQILNIHGFGSSGANSKAQILNDLFGADSVISPDVAPRPREAFGMLEGVWKPMARTGVVLGSSLGGFYALCLVRRYGGRAILVNPSLTPWETTGRYLGMNTNFYTGEQFEWRREHMDELKRIHEETPAFGGGDMFVMLGAEDELIDHRIAMAAFPSARVVVALDEGHEFFGLGRYREEILRFICAG